MADSDTYDFDVVLSFASEQRELVERVADHLRDAGVRYFLDSEHTLDMWGENLADYLTDLYKDRSRFCIVFWSEQYATKEWTELERRAAQARALKERSNAYILPVRLDDSDMDRILPTIGYLSMPPSTEAEVAVGVVKKIGGSKRSNFVPENIGRWWQAVLARYEEDYGIDSPHYKRLIELSPSLDIVRVKLEVIVTLMSRMTLEERIEVVDFLLYSCQDGLPDRIHVGTDFLRRSIAPRPLAGVEVALSGLTSLGVDFRVSERPPDDAETEQIGHSERTYWLDWDWMSRSPGGGPIGYLAEAAFFYLASTCRGCFDQAITHCDFGGLRDEHGAGSRP